MMQEIIDGVDAHAMNCTELMELPLTPENRTDAKIFSFRMIKQLILQSEMAVE